jgi:hypothetical protein
LRSVNPVKGLSSPLLCASPRLLDIASSGCLPSCLLCSLDIASSDCLPSYAVPSGSCPQHLGLSGTGTGRVPHPLHLRCRCAYSGHLPLGAGGTHFPLRVERRTVERASRMGRGAHGDGDGDGDGPTGYRLQDPRPQARGARGAGSSRLAARAVRGARCAVRGARCAVRGARPRPHVLCFILGHSQQLAASAPAVARLPSAIVRLRLPLCACGPAIVRLPLCPCHCAPAIGCTWAWAVFVLFPTKYEVVPRMRYFDSAANVPVIPGLLPAN